MSIKYLYISLLALILVSTISMGQSINTNGIRLATQTKEYVAGETVLLEFKAFSNKNAILYCSNSYGSVVIPPMVENNTLTFEIPNSISKKAGVINWQLLNASRALHGNVIIIPKSTIHSLENYLGPPSIEAGGTDYSMLVVIPTDDLDNPLADSTKVSINHQFLDHEVTNDVFTKHGMAYKNIYSYEKNGRMLISSSRLGLNSKEYDINVVPAIPTNFTISADRIHSYADGNQITTFKTSEIRDRYNNTVSDGTFVNFYITNKDGNKTMTSGSTINGVAMAKVLHPDREDQWSIKAYIEGMANSDSIRLDYKQAISDFDVEFSEDQRTITVGPLQSFMKQHIPDGLAVTLKVFKDNTLDDELLERSYAGYATFKLKQDRYPKGNYKFVIETAGLSKSFTNITYE